MAVKHPASVSTDGRVNQKVVELNEECNFWESEINHIKKCSQVGGKNVLYYDDGGVLNFTFFHWTRKWIDVLSTKYLDPYKLHPLPKSDQILYWQPIFSRYVSDELIKVEQDHLQASQSPGYKGPYKVRAFIFLRAALRTFWTRILFAFVGMVAMNILSMSIAILLSYLFKLMTSTEYNYGSIMGLILLIILLELFKGICIDHVTFYIQRLIVMFDYSLGITLFQHGMCLRRNYANYESAKYKCNNFVHSCAEGSSCMKSPFMCSARRHKNIDITPKMYSYKFVDCYYISLVFDNLTDIVTFLTNFVYGIILINVKMKIKVWSVFAISMGLMVFMAVLEVFNGYLLKFYYALRDHRVSKSFEIITNFKLIKTLTMEDIAHKMITDIRNDELAFVVYRFFVSLLNKVVYMVCVTCAFLIIIRDFVEQLKRTSDVKSIDSSSIITIIFILLKIVDPMYMLPLALRLLIMVINSYNRIEFHIRTCSPNYYQFDRFLVDPNLKSKSLRNSRAFIHQKLETERCLGDLNRLDECKRVSQSGGSVVSFEDASFSWIYNRDDLIAGDNPVLLENIDFKLARGEIVIVEGSQGSGKSNFIKAILGEMTLVGGSMFVLPLSKSMPIFYASQDVWLRRGTVRSNIVFGLYFDEEIYSTVVKAIELESDFSNWEDGDLRSLTEKGFGLSGGQRVRVEFARAVYAYMIYSKVKKEYSYLGSFLMCLDSVFVGLDPFVGGNIFHNLFNSTNGILVKGDLAVVMTTSRRSLETSVSSSSPASFGDLKMYRLRNKKLKFWNNFRSFLYHTNNFLANEDYDTEGSKNNMDYKIDEMGDKKGKELYKRCRSKDFERGPRRSVIMDQYDDKSQYGSTKISGYAGINSVVFGSMLLYIRSAGSSFFIFIFLLIGCTVLDNMRYIFASRLSNFVNDHIKGLADFMDDQSKCESTHALIRDYSTKSFSLIGYLSIFVIITCIAVVIMMTLVSFTVSRRIHEYSLESALYKSSIYVKIKRYVSDVITFLSCDTLYVDLAIGYYIFDSSVLLVETLIHMIMLMYLIPTSFLFVLIASFVMVRFPILWFIKSLSNIRFAYMASINRINCVLNDAISGSLVCRSYRKESELVDEFVEHVDYSNRCRFLERASYTWASLTCRCIFSAMIFLVILTPLTLSKISTYSIKIGYYGLAFSFSLNFTNRFSKLLRIYTRLQLYLCSIKRFEGFVPIDERLEFKSAENIYMEDILVNPGVEGSESEDENRKGDMKLGVSVADTVSMERVFSCEEDEFFNCVDVLGLKNKYLMRRRTEFYSVRSKISVRSLFFKPIVNIIEIAQYLDPVHRGIKLENVFVLANSATSLELRKPVVGGSGSGDVELKLISLDSGSVEKSELGTNIDHPKKRFILFDVNKEASRSQIIGIVGRTGAGKTTLLSVLLNLAKARRGAVLVDGVDLNQIPREILRQIVGVLPQLPFVFRGWTLRMFLDPRRLFSDGQIFMALDKCGLLEFVRGLAHRPLDLVVLPDYYHKDMPRYLKRVYYLNLYETTSGPGSIGKSNLDSKLNSAMDAGLVLSNTQMRTLMVARLVLYRHFYRMILIDEPPSDNCSDVKTTPPSGTTPRSTRPESPHLEMSQIGVPVYRLLSEYFTHCTTFIAAHDVNALKSCTKLWILNKGRLVMTCDREQMVHDDSLASLIKESMET